EYLARVLRGEPLVPLSDVTFAEAAGRVTAVARQRSETNGTGDAEHTSPEAAAGRDDPARADPARAEPERVKVAVGARRRG
ncbi:MAG TPA: hypothetical protein VGQ85_07910, partial [Candidatus Limnocylindrales bacterium]|nr:hypothetical protein [Candidatus Limnocylindrales bacterium]